MVLFANYKPFMKHLIILFLFLSFTFQKSSDDILYFNYSRAVKNNTVEQYHLVIKVKNLKTNEVREICTLGRILSEVIHVDKNLNYTKTDIEKANKIMLKNKERYFKFSTDSAIYNLGMHKYSMKELKSLEKRINFDSLASQIKLKGKWQMNLQEKNRLMYGHALFNRGILTGQKSNFDIIIYVANK